MTDDPFVTHRSLLFTVAYEMPRCSCVLVMRSIVSHRAA
jgi:hypothetical protein